MFGIGDRMLYLAIFSGLVNLAAQSVFMRVVSAANGDYYLTYFLTTLSFIVFSSVGNLLGYRLRKWLPAIELGAGAYALAIFGLIRGGMLASFGLPTVVVVLVLMPPAFALGTHIPLYAHFVRQRIGLTYGLYHMGAALGVLAIEWFVLPYVPLSAALGILGVSQVGLGLVVGSVFYVQKFAQGIETMVPAVAWHTWARRNQHALIAVFLASLASYLAIGWGLKNLENLLLPTRMHNGVYNGVVLLMLAAGGLGSLLMSRMPLAVLAPVAGIGGLAGMAFYSALPDLLRNATFLAIEVSVFTLALLFSIPVFLSAVVFNRVADGMSGERDMNTGRLMFVAAVGNLAGGFAVILAGPVTLTVWPALVAGSLLAFVLIAWSGFRDSAVVALGSFVLAAISLGGMTKLTFDPVQTVFSLRSPQLRFEGSEFTSNLGSTAGYVYGRQIGGPADSLPDLMVYFVDGHDSHNILSDMETAVGLLPSQFISRPFKKSMVIGVGSGQTSYGVSTISERTDIVEISPAVIEALPMFSAYNHEVWKHAGTEIHKDDGLNFARHCSAGTYDYIFNTSTYPMMFNAYKLYTNEFVAAAKRCLRPDGIFQVYFDDNAGNTVEQVRAILAPLAKHFKYIGITPNPYPNVFASDHPLVQKNVIDLTAIVRSDRDRQILRKMPEVLQAIGCSGWYAPEPLMPTRSTPLSTLDEPFIERTSMFQRLNILTHQSHPQQSEVYRLMQSHNPRYTSAACQGPQDQTHAGGGVEAALHVRVHTPNEEAAAEEPAQRVNLIQDVRVTAEGVKVVDEQPRAVSAAAQTVDQMSRHDSRSIEVHSSSSDQAGSASVR